MTHVDDNDDDQLLDLSDSNKSYGTMETQPYQSKVSSCFILSTIILLIGLVSLDITSIIFGLNNSNATCDDYNQYQLISLPHWLAILGTIDFTLMCLLISIGLSSIITSIDGRCSLSFLENSIIFALSLFIYFIIMCILSTIALAELIIAYPLCKDAIPDVCVIILCFIAIKFASASIPIFRICYNTYSCIMKCQYQKN